MELIREQFFGLMADQHREWVEATKKNLLTVRSKNSKNDGVKFFEYLEQASLPELFEDEWADHPLSSLLPTLSDESRIQLYLDLNKALKSSRAAGAAGQDEPKSAMKSTGTKRKSASRVTTLSKDSQQTVKDLMSDPVVDISDESPKRMTKRSKASPTLFLGSDDEEDEDAERDRSTQMDLDEDEQEGEGEGEGDE